MTKTLDQKISNILADPSCSDFLLADAKDADMGGGVAAPGPRRPQDGDGLEFRSLTEYRQAMRDITRQGLVDIMLMSANTSELLTIEERLFDDSSVTPAVRVNDTTDIWMAANTDYAKLPSRPFRSTTIAHAQCGKANCEPHERSLGADLGLYSVTFNNNLLVDRESLECYKAFRLEAEQQEFRYFLEVFAPNALQGQVEEAGRFVNDCIASSLAGVTRRGRPLFLKIPYFGPAAMEQLASYDRTVLVGILGGPSGTTHDAFRMLWEAKKYRARAALFGRKINNAEDQLQMVAILREVADDNLAPEEAVRAYHGELQKLGVEPDRPLDDDLRLTQV